MLFETYPLDVSLTGLEVESSVSGMIGGGSGTLGLSDWKPGEASSAGTFKGERGRRGYGQRQQADIPRLQILLAAAVG